MKKSYDQPRQHLKKQRHYFANKGPSSQSYGFSSSHVRMWELDYKESWAPKNWYFWTVVLEKILESHLDSEEIQPVHPEGNQSWIFIWRTDIEAETPLLWPPNTKNWLIGKDPDAGKDWRWEEQGMTEDEMIGWHHRLNGHEIEKALGVGDGQGSLACTTVHGVSKSRTQLSNWTDWLTPDMLPRLLGVRNGNPLQCSCLENPTDRGAWQATIHGVAKSSTWLSTHSPQTQLFSEPLSPGFVSSLHMRSVEEDLHSSLGVLSFFY